MKLFFLLNKLRSTSDGKSLFIKSKWAIDTRRVSQRNGELADASLIVRPF